MVKFKQSWVLFKACIFLGHLFNQSFLKMFIIKSECFFKIHSSILFYFILFLRDSSIFLFKILTDITAYDFTKTNFKYVLIFI